MTDLKTLKDIDVAKDEFDPIILPSQFVVIDSLKREAIKWIKEDIKTLKNLDSENFYYICADARVEWIKHFFNITDKDIESYEISNNPKIMKEIKKSMKQIKEGKGIPFKKNSMGVII